MGDLRNITKGHYTLFDVGKGEMAKEVFDLYSQAVDYAREKGMVSKVDGMELDNFLIEWKGPREV